MVCSVKAITRSQKGFSITELLVTSAILVLVSAIMAAGVPAALRAYMGVVDASNAQLLLATTSTRLRDELGVANTSEDISDGATVSFVSLETGYNTTIQNDASKGICLVQSSDSLTLDPTPLVPQAGGMGAKRNLHTSFESINYQNGVFTVNNLQVLDGNNSPVAGAKFETLEIRALAASQS